MKYALLFVTLLSGCSFNSIRAKVGDCYFSETWQKGLNITKVTELGYFGTVVYRKSTVILHKPLRVEEKVYVTDRQFSSLYLEKVDCEALQILEAQ